MVFASKIASDSESHFVSVSFYFILLQKPYPTVIARSRSLLIFPRERNRTDVFTHKIWCDRALVQLDWNKITCNVDTPLKLLVQSKIQRKRNYLTLRNRVHDQQFSNFFKKKIGGHKSFLWGHWSPVLDFWWCLLWFSKPEWAVLFVLGRGIHVTHSLRLTSGATPADLLATSMAAKPISSTYLTCDHALVGLKREIYHATGKRSTTELYRLGSNSVT